MCTHRSLLLTLLTLCACGHKDDDDPQRRPECPDCEECEECPEDTGDPCSEDSGDPCPEDTDNPCPEDTGDSAEPPPEPLLVAIYDDGEGDFPSAWAEGLDYIEESMQAAGYLTERIGRDELNSEPGILWGFDALLFGGGFAYPGYTLYISGAGKARIQEFVYSGGAYVGICAGAYFVCDDLYYEGIPIGDESGYNIDLYPGTCGGPVHEVSSYPNWAPATIEFPGHEAYDGFDTPPFEMQLYYAGGPYFEDMPADTEVLATYNDDGPHQGLAAVITRPYGEGRIVLWGPHPEVLQVDTAPHVSMEVANRELYATVVGWAARGDEE